MLVTLKRFHKAGYPTYAIIGGATGRIGDPSGKLSERKLLNLDLVSYNVDCITKQINKITGISAINNYIFYKNMNIFDFFGKALDFFRKRCYKMV